MYLININLHHYNCPQSICGRGFKIFVTSTIIIINILKRDNNNHFSLVKSYMIEASDFLNVKKLHNQPLRKRKHVVFLLSEASERAITNDRWKYIPPIGILFYFSSFRSLFSLFYLKNQRKDAYD